MRAGEDYTRRRSGARERPLGIRMNAPAAMKPKPRRDFHTSGSFRDTARKSRRQDQLINPPWYGAVPPNRHAMPSGWQPPQPDSKNAMPQLTRITQRRELSVNFRGRTSKVMHTLRQTTIRMGSMKERSSALGPLKFPRNEPAARTTVHWFRISFDFKTAKARTSGQHAF